jgi:polar amino acid transport system substrate-binding protein
MRRLFPMAAALALAMTCSPAQAQAQNPKKNDLRVGIAIFSPCVMDEDGKIKGFEVDLWEAICKEAKLSGRFQQTGFTQLINNVKEGKVDVAFAGVTATAQREQDFDFTMPYLNSGLRIVVKEGGDNPLTGVSSPLRSRVLKLLAYFFVFVILGSHIMWFCERGEEGLNDKYFPGILEAVWFTIVTSTTVGYGDFTPKAWLTRAVCILVMFGGVGFFGFVISEVTAALTTANLQYQMKHQELAGKLVGTQEGTVAEDYLKSIGAIPVTFDKIEQAFEKVATGDIPYAVFDSPSILYYTRTKGKGRVKTVGKKFYRHYIAIALPKDSSLREPINQALLKIKETGAYDRIYNEWFGQ